ncbi:Ferrous iron transport protein B homolog [Thiomonas sp. X19]|uniref:ferrous iron transport protein B n=1 Tax=Thiomonas sp. X19 TaxID=1050370 RepID=UPI000B644E9B|nr:ferrous iron transport protein B [Thiomonas sp. X19]SCC92727.1 Ferrous iron transport protein B homolog [Thiomonas sp. X19]
MKRIALVGMPNTGKSTLFNRLTGASARVGNWPGLTVELASARIPLGRHMAQIVDLPGIYDLQGLTEDENAVQRFLQSQSVDLVAVVINATQIDRQLALAVQVRDSGFPCIVLLNMADEAERYGVGIDPVKLQAALGVPVASLSAKYGRGYPQALQLLGQALETSTPLALEQARAGLEQRRDGQEGARAALSAAVQLPTRLPDTWAQRIDHWVMHPWIGPPLFLAFMALVFNAVFTLGAPLQEGLGWVFDQLRVQVLAPTLAAAPAWFSGLLLDGIYNGLSTVAAFVPVIMLFFVFMTLIEESGYFSRAAFLTDSLMSRMGLDGRGFVMLLMGFGCNVPALMGTRVMRSRGLRLLTMLIIPFSLCSARLQVFLFIIAALFSPRVAPWVLLSLYGVSFAATFASALLFKQRYPSNEPFVLELPPYRLPTMRQILLRAWGEIHHFLHRATKFIVIGVVLVWMLTNLPPGQPTAGPHTLAGWVGHALHPAFAPLGIPPELIIALIFGFVAKEIVIGSLAVIYGLQGDALQHAVAAQITPAAAYSFMLFTLIYTPCLSTVAALRSESKSNAYTWLSLGWSLGLAWMVSLAFYQGTRLLGWA